MSISISYENFPSGEWETEPEISVDESKVVDYTPFRIQNDTDIVILEEVIDDAIQQIRLLRDALSSREPVSRIVALEQSERYLSQFEAVIVE